MTSLDKCPFCGSYKLVPGSVKSQECFGFLPDEHHGGFTIRNIFAFAFGPSAIYCATCFMVWAKADSNDAAKFIQKFGTPELNARIAATDSDTKKEPPAR